MSNNDSTHKKAVLEFLYATAAEAVAATALGLVEVYGDNEGADKLLDNPLSRAGFADIVSKELRAAFGGVTIPDATVGQVADAAKAAVTRVHGDARIAASSPKRPAIVVVAGAGPAPAPNAVKGSSDFGAN
jgi:hypothetical protein